MSLRISETAYVRKKRKNQADMNGRTKIAEGRWRTADTRVWRTESPGQLAQEAGDDDENGDRYLETILKTSKRLQNGRKSLTQLTGWMNTGSRNLK